MPKYKLTYFNMKGRAEPIRWMFAYANQEYEDARFDRETEWPTKKLEMAYGKIPSLEVDGKHLYSSSVICRYLAKTFDLMPEDPFQQAVCDEVVDGFNDCLMSARDIFFARLAGKTEEVEKLAAEFATTIFPPIAKALEGRLEKNEWFGGSKISWADIYIGFFMEALTATGGEALYALCPKVKIIIQKVKALPGIAKWIKERPETKM